MTSIAFLSSAYLVGKYKLAADGECTALHLKFALFDKQGLTAIARFAYYAIATAFLVGFAGAWIQQSSEPVRATRNARAIIWSSTTLLLIFLSRPHNAVLFLLFTAQAVFLWKQASCHARVYSTGNSDAYRGSLSLTLLILTHTSFYNLGGSNSIASVDIGNSYVGVEAFTAAVGLLTFLANWSGPLWWSVTGSVIFVELNGTRMIARRPPARQGFVNRYWNLECTTIGFNDPAGQTNCDRVAASMDKSVVYSHLYLCAAYRAIATTVLSLSVTLFRTHLFVWTVFSPRWLYEAAWVLGYGFCNIFIWVFVGEWSASSLNSPGIPPIELAKV